MFRKIQFLRNIMYIQNIYGIERVLIFVKLQNSEYSAFRMALTKTNDLEPLKLSIIRQAVLSDIWVPHFSKR